MMEKTIFRRENREDGAVAATAVRTRHADHDRVQLDGFSGPGETPKEQANRGLTFADRFLREYCDGRLEDVTMVRQYICEDLLPEAEFEIGKLSRVHFIFPPSSG